MLNVIVLQGRLTHNPELKSSSTGKYMTSFSIAVDRGFGENKTTDFFDCTAWEWTAKFITSYFTKGQMILVSGKLETNEYTGRDGNARKTVRINVSNAEFCGNKNDAAASSASDPEPVESVDAILDDQDLPF